MVDMNAMKRAGLGIRLAALAIDWALATMTTALFVPPFSSAIGPSALRLGIFVLEVSIVTGFSGSSMGQRMMGLRVLSWPDHLLDRKSTRLNSSHVSESRMPSSA